MNCFDHEKLDVYKVAVEFVILSNEIAEQLPRGKAYLADNGCSVSAVTVFRARARIRARARNYPVNGYDFWSYIEAFPEVLD